jgi:putative transcriptional regulator
MNFNLSLSDTAVLRELGSRLAQYRLNQNLTQERLAHEAGISLRTLTRIENGEPSQTSNVLRLLRALGLLDNLDALVPAPAVSPIEQLKLKGKVRQRASSSLRNALLNPGCGEPPRPKPPRPVRPVRLVRVAERASPNRMASTGGLARDTRRSQPLGARDRRGVLG